jgi:uncharacterized protein DUF4440
MLNLYQSEPPMSQKPQMIKVVLACALLIACALPKEASTQTEHKPAEAPRVEQDLISTEIGFFEAWKTRDEAYFRAHMADNGIFWGESGTLSRDQQLQQQQANDKACKVEGYGLSDFGVLPLTTGAYLLTYKADQYATCNGEKLPVHMNGSSIYILKAGHWQAIYRAEVPLSQP